MVTLSDKGIIIVGAGGHGKVVADALRASGELVLGFTDRDTALTSPAEGQSILGNDDLLSECDRGLVRLALGVGSTRPGDVRRKVHNHFRQKGFRFATVIHPSAVVAEDVVLEDGCQVMAGAVIQPGSRLGTCSIVNTNASVDHDCIIGSFAHIAPGVTLSGGVVLGDGCHIGTGASIIQNVSIGANAFITAGSVVTDHIAAEERV